MESNATLTQVPELEDRLSRMPDGWLVLKTTVREPYTKDYHVLFCVYDSAESFNHGHARGSGPTALEALREALPGFARRCAHCGGTNE